MVGKPEANKNKLVYDEYFRQITLQFNFFHLLSMSVDDA